jgi:hypothetical protein
VNNANPDTTAQNAPLHEELNIPSRDKETDPAASLDAQKDAAEGLGDSLPSQPQHAVTQ